MTQDKEAFLERWSRRKQEQAVEQPAPLVENKEEQAAPLPPVEQLAPESDFKPFMDSRVDPATRRDALKKLFTDAHFNIPDPFEPYSIDLTGEDPISPEFLKTLNQAKRLLFDESEKIAQAPAEQPPETLLQKAGDVPGKQGA